MGRNDFMNLSSFISKRHKVGLVLFLIIVMCGLSGCGDNYSNTAKKQETKQEVVQESKTHDANKEKESIKATLPANGYNLKNISISEQKDGAYTIMSDLEIPQKDEPVVRNTAIKAIKEIKQANTGKDYDIESIAITVTSKKRPIGLYQFTSAKYSVSGNDEYSVMINGKREVLQ